MAGLRKTILILFVGVVLVQTASCGAIIEDVKQGIGKGVHKVDCAFKTIGDFLGIAKKCEPEVKIESGSSWQVQNGIEQTTLSQYGYNQGSFGQNGYGQQNSFEQNGYRQNSDGQNGFRSSSGGQNDFRPISGSQNGFRPNPVGQNGYGQNSYGQNGYGQNQYGQNGYEQNQYGQNGFRQGNNGEFGSSGLNSGQSSYGQGGYRQNSGLGGVDSNINSVQTSSGYGKPDTRFSVVTETTSNIETVSKDHNRGLDMRFQQVDTPTPASPIDTTTKLKMDGRRIISAHSNCGPGYVADSRGRCRETF